MARRVYLWDVLPKTLRMAGKSYIAQAFANRAILDGFRAYYIRTSSLLEEIRVARVDGTYTNLLKKYLKFQVLKNNYAIIHK